MTTIYHISIDNGAISYDCATVTKADIEANKYHAINAKQYFAAHGKDKPNAVAVRGWPFGKMYLTHGTEENGQAVAWA